MTLSSWYFGSESVYFDILYTDSKLQRFKIIIKPDLSGGSFHVLKMTDVISDDLTETLDIFGPCCEGYQICEDALVFFWNNRNSKTWGTYAALTSAPFTNVVARCQWTGNFDCLSSTSGRFVYCIYDRGNNRMAVVDLF